MKLQKAFLASGMISSITLISEDLLGIVLWRGYNPIKSYMSELFADGAPPALLTRTLLYISQFCLVIFLITVCVKIIKFYGMSIKIGYIGLLFTASSSILGYGLFPMTLNNIISIKNLIHFIITVSIVIATMILFFFLAFGYKRENRGFSIVFAVLFLFFNLLHLYAILKGINILGLLERASFYTFEIYIFVISFFYVFKTDRGNTEQNQDHSNLFVTKDT